MPSTSRIAASPRRRRWGRRRNAFAAKLASLTSVALGAANAVRFAPLPGTPAIPARFGGSILTAVAAGASGGGFDAAYISGSDSTRRGGSSSTPAFRSVPDFDEFIGFLYGKIVNGISTGLELVQWMLDAHNRNVVVLPIVASSEQLSGYFPLPIGDNAGHRRGIGLAGTVSTELDAALSAAGRVRPRQGVRQPRRRAG